MNEGAINVDEEGGATLDLTVEHAITTDAEALPDDIHGLAHRLIAAYAGPLDIAGQAWNVIDHAQFDEHCLIIPIPNDIGEECDNVYLFLVLQWYKRRTRMSQVLAVADNEVLDLLTATGPGVLRWRETFASLIDYYQERPINTGPRFGDECPNCYGTGRQLRDGHGNKHPNPPQCLPCQGKGRLPTFEQYCKLLIAFRAGPVSKRQHGRKVGRNDPCPCSSGRKYKVCHGR